MSDRKFDLTADESDRDIERRSRPSTVPEDHLKTTRMAPIAPPPIGPLKFSSAPPPPFSISSPPSAVVAVAPRLPSFEPDARDSQAPSLNVPGPTTDAPVARSSWWRSLLTATVPPGRRDAVSVDEVVLRKRAGAGAAVLSFALVVAALVVGLRSAPAIEPAVAATVVASRAVIALGLLAFALALGRAAERLFFAPADGSDTARAAGAQRADGQPIN